MKEQDKKYIFSKVFCNGDIVETVYNPETYETNFLVYHGDGEPKFEDKYSNEKEGDFFPVPASNHLILKQFIQLASGFKQYAGNSQLFQEVRDFIAQYMKLPDSFLTIAAVYVFLTWTYDCFSALGYLRVIGTFGTGKSRFLQIMNRLCYRSFAASGVISNSAVFRTNDFIQGTMLMDEADYKNSDMSSQIVKNLNSGHTKNSPAVRMRPNANETTWITEAFNVFGPKILASRERFEDEALESRCLTVQLLPLRNIKRPIHLTNEFEAKAAELRNKLMSFRFDHRNKIIADEDTLEGIEFPRLQQSALALTTVAKILGDDVLSEVLKFLRSYERELTLVQRQDIKADILECILGLVKNNSTTTHNKMYMLDISREFDRRYYNEYDDSHGKHYGAENGASSYKSGAISAKRVGTYVEKLGIRKAHDGGGFYIPLPQEINTLEALADRYGLEKPIWAPKHSKNNLELPLNGGSDTINPEDIPF